MSKMTIANKPLPQEQREALLKTLKTGFEKNMNRHKGNGAEFYYAGRGTRGSLRV